MEMTTTLNKGGAYDESILLWNNIKLGIYAISAIGENINYFAVACISVLCTIKYGC